MTGVAQPVDEGWVAASCDGLDGVAMRRWRPVRAGARWVTVAGPHVECNLG
ncbi:MAG: hypothetical protein Q8O56_14990 [Solirubrobacteraceae bacterium]|nr:hypothetical protein [Solirubrobacteraceae bacterium]